MSTQGEVERIRNVYQGYSSDTGITEKWSSANQGNTIILQKRRYALEVMLQKSGYLPLRSCNVLEIGCGCGQELANCLTWGAHPTNLYGIDLLADRIATAQQLYPDLHFQQANAEQLGFVDASFDLVLLVTVFTSIIDTQMAHQVAAESQRVLKPGGAIVWYDFRYNNPSNPNVRGMTKARINKLFPDFTLHMRSITLLPPLARRLGPLTRVLYPILAAVPFLRTHYLGILIKPTYICRTESEILRVN